MADALGKFRKLCSEIYGLDPAKFLSAPGLALQAAMNKTYPYSGWSFFSGLITDGGACLPVTHILHPTMMKLGSYTLPKEDPKNILIP